MVPFKIGNWEITEDGIEWRGGENDYFIEKESLMDVGTGDRRNMYDFLVHLTEKTWLTDEDLYSLNTAFVYAMEYFNYPFNQVSFVKTFQEQERLLKLRRGRKR